MEGLSGNKKKPFTFDKNGKLKIFDEFQKRKKLHESARTLLLLSKSK